MGVAQVGFTRGVSCSASVGKSMGVAPGKFFGDVSVERPCLWKDMRLALFTQGTMNIALVCKSKGVA